MMNKLIVLICLTSTILVSNSARATVFLVNSQTEFDNAHDNASMNDSIIWESGTYSDIYMDVDESHLYIAAQVSGGTIFNGASRLRIDGDYITFTGFQYIGGDIGTDMVIDVYGSHVTLSQLNIDAYTCYKYLRVRESSQYVDISYCNFENRLNLDDQNILSLLVDANQPGYHKVRHCSFKNFDGTGNDLGIEPIRIGVSTQAEFISRSLVEYCYFTQCNGDGELISSKARQNVYRYNTFDDNPLAELVLRHGDENVVYGNFFLNGKGGVRVREGQDHYIYNNYFYNLHDRAIFLQNQDDDQLDNINIAFNVIIECDEVILGGTGDEPPLNVTFANNIFTNPNNDLFDDPTGNETWSGNIAFGDLGMTLPSSGVTVTNPGLFQNSNGFYGLFSNSVAIDAAQPSYPFIPQFPGMDLIDTDLELDMMLQARPQSVSQRDVGPNEYPHDNGIAPIANASNTGPYYLTGAQPIVTHVIGNAGINFNPAVLTIHLGDEVDFQLTSSHDAVEMSEADYLSLSGNPLTGGFATPFGGGLVPATQLGLGTHYYYCTPHVGLGMVGIIKVVNCLGDLDGDGLINVNDFLELNSAFGGACAGCMADIDDDGIVNVNDFLTLNSAFGQTCP